MPEETRRVARAAFPKGAFRIFIGVAEAGSLSAVTRKVGATQPAVSRQVAAPEEHLGMRLIQRMTRSLALTEDGRDLLGPPQAHSERPR